MLVHRRVTPSIKFAGTHLYTWVERGTVRVKCLAQEHHTMSQARARTQTARSGVKRTNHEATAPPHSVIHTPIYFIFGIFCESSELQFSIWLNQRCSLRRMKCDFIIAHHRQSIMINENNCSRCTVFDAHISDTTLTFTIQITLPLIPVFYQETKKELCFMLLITIQILLTLN